MFVISPAGFNALKADADKRATIDGAQRLESNGLTDVGLVSLQKAWELSSQAGEILGWTDNFLIDRLARLMVNKSTRNPELTTASVYVALFESDVEPGVILTALERQLL